MTLVRLDWQQDTAIVSFARPPVNAFDLALMEELQERLDELSAQAPGGGVVLTGDGDAFSAGVDFKQVPGYSRDRRALMIRLINSAVTALYALPTATVAAVNGHAIGGGLIMALACDARLAARAPSKLGLTEVTAGLPYPACPMELLRAEIEPAHRRRLVLSGELVEPPAAQASGLIDDVVAPDQLLARAVELARRRAGAVSYALVKQQLKGAAGARMREIVASGSDPLIDRLG